MRRLYVAGFIQDLKVMYQSPLSTNFFRATKYSHPFSLIIDKDIASFLGIEFLDAKLPTTDDFANFDVGEISRSSCTASRSCTTLGPCECALFRMAPGCGHLEGTAIIRLAHDDLVRGNLQFPDQWRFFYSQNQIVISPPPL